MADEELEKRKDDGEGGRNTAALVLAGILGVFAVLNLDEVEVNWGIAKSDTPLIIVIADAVLLGAGIGWLAARRG